MFTLTESKCRALAMLIHPPLSNCYVTPGILSGTMQFVVVNGLTWYQNQLLLLNNMFPHLLWGPAGLKSPRPRYSTVGLGLDAPAYCTGYRVAATISATHYNKDGGGWGGSLSKGGSLTALHNPLLISVFSFKYLRKWFWLRFVCMSN